MHHEINLFCKIMIGTLLVFNSSCFFLDDDSKSDKESEIVSNHNEYVKSNHVTLVFKDHIWALGGTVVDDGYNSQQAYNTIYKSNNGLEWVVVKYEAEWGRRTRHGGVVFNNKMWIMGGMNCKYDVSYAFRDIWSSSDGENWECEGLAPWAERYGHAVIVHNNKIFVIGGQQTPELYFNDIWSSTNGLDWNLEKSDGLPLSNGSNTINISNTAAASYAGKIWLVGGQSFIGTNDGNYEGFSELQYLAEVWSSPDGITWSNETNGSDRVSEFARAEARLTVFQDKLWLSGGTYENDTDYSVYCMDTSSGYTKPPWIETNYPLNKLFQTNVQSDEISMWADGYLYYQDGRPMSFLNNGMFGISQHSFIAYKNQLLIFWGKCDATFYYAPDEYGYTSNKRWTGFFTNMYRSIDGYNWEILNDTLSLHNMSTPVYDWWGVDDGDVYWYKLIP
ncbi:MAG TPA: hypothetical protein PK341_16905 [Spirochaetota bacterium]|nr:hypothetical protein [Spirochaetota bacterium]